MPRGKHWGRGGNGSQLLQPPPPVVAGAMAGIEARALSSHTVVCMWDEVPVHTEGAWFHQTAQHT